MVESRVAEGAAPRLDLLRVRANSLRTRADADAAHRGVAVAAARLALWLGGPMNRAEPLHADGDPPNATSVVPLAALLSDLEHHPILVAARSRADMSRANVALEVRRRLPVVGIEVGTTFFDSTLAPGPNQGTPAFSDAHIALSAEVPMFNAHGPVIARARTAETLAHVETSAIRVQLESDLRATYARLEAEAARATAQWRDVLPATQEASEMALESYRAGRSDINGLLAAQQAVADARLTAWRVSADLARAVAAVERAGGRTL